KERPEFLAVGGLVLALAGLGLDQAWLAVSGASVAVTGLALRALVRIRADRAAAAVQRALGATEDRGASFQRLVDTVARLWPPEWMGLLSWDEDGLGGSIEHERGAGGPAPAALTGWLVREA